MSTYNVYGPRLGVSDRNSWNDQDARIENSHDAIYTVVTDDYEASPATIKALQGVPYIGQPSPFKPTSICVGVDATEIAPGVWDVVGQYSNNVVNKPSDEQGDSSDESNQPWDRQPTWSWGSEIVEEPLLFDAIYTFKPIENSAGEPLPPLTQPVTLPVLRITKWKQTFDGQEILDYTNTVNEVEFWGAAPRCALMSEINADPEEKDGQKYWKVVYVIKFRLKDEYGWTVRLLDQGTWYWDSGVKGQGKKIPFSDDTYQQIVGNLNGLGGPAWNDDPVFLDPLNRYQELDWSSLDLGPWA